MEIVRKAERQEYKNGDYCIAYEYPMADNDINAAIIKLTGRYPENSFSVNEVSKELVYVISGSGKVVFENEKIELKQGDMILIPPGKKFYWDGQMEVIMPCTPAWTPEQHKEVN